MTIYIVLFIIITILSLVEINVDSIIICNRTIKTRKIAFIIIFIFILSVGVLKSEYLGTDSFNYKTLYFDYWRNENIISFNALKNDFGYVFINWFIGLFTDNYWLYKAILFTICFTSFSIWIYKKSSFVSISFLLFCSLSFLRLDFGTLRQAAALSIAIWAYDSLIDKKLKKFLIITLLASLFHLTALTMIVIYFFANVKLNKNWFINNFVMLSIICIGCFFSTPVLIRFYALLRNDYSDLIVTGKGINLLLFYLLVFLVLYLYIRKTDKTDSLIKQFNIATITLYLQVTTVFFSLFSRIVHYSTVFLCLFIPNLLKKQKHSSRIVLFLIIWIAMAVLFFYTTATSESHIYPYVSIWG